MRKIRVQKVPGPYAATDDVEGAKGAEGATIATGKRNEVVKIAKARAAALQASGVDAVVEEIDEHGRVLHTFPFYTSGAPLPMSDDDERGADVYD